MMSTSNRTIMDLVIEENFNENHTRLQGRKWPLEDQQFKNKDQSFDHQGSIIGCRQDKNFKPEL